MNFNRMSLRYRDKFHAELLFRPLNGTSLNSAASNASWVSCRISRTTAAEVKSIGMDHGTPVP